MRTPTEQEILTEFGFYTKANIKMTLEKRIELAYKILGLCDPVIKKNPSKKMLKIYKEVLEFLMITLQVEQRAQIDAAMQLKSSSKQSNLWHKIAKLALDKERRDVVSVSKDKQEQDNKKRIKYLSPDERDKYRAILMKDPSSHNHDTRFMQRTRKNRFKLINTTLMTAHQHVTFAAFTFNLQGEISFFNHIFKLNKIAHSSTNAGAPVIYAGEMKIRNGKLIAINDHSGHYKPSNKNLYRFMDHIVKQDVDITHTVVMISTPLEGVKHKKRSIGGIYTYSALDFMQHMQQKIATEVQAKQNLTFQNIKTQLYEQLVLNKIGEICNITDMKIERGQGKHNYILYINENPVRVNLSHAKVIQLKFVDHKNNEQEVFVPYKKSAKGIELNERALSKLLNDKLTSQPALANLPQNK